MKSRPRFIHRIIVSTALSAMVIAGCTGAIGESGSGAVDPGAPRGPTPAAPAAPGMAAPTGGAPTSDAPAAGLPPATDPAPVSARFSCNEAQSPPEARMRRLTNVQYRNTLKDLFTLVLGNDPAQGMAVMTEIANALGRMPKDERAPVPQDVHGAYRRMDQDLDQAYVDGAYEVGLAAGAALAKSTRLARLMGPCATDGNAANDEDCIAGFIQSFGERALRRPLATDEKAFLRKAYGTGGPPFDPAAIADVVAVILNMPGFLYLVEHGEAAVAGRRGSVRLSAHELAARLSFQFWQSMPDMALEQAARSGELLTAAAYAREVDRLFRDPRTRETIDEFYTDWLKLADVRSLEDKATDPVFKALAGDDLPGKTLRQNAVDDTLDLLRHFTWTKPAAFATLLDTELSFAKGADVARLYGVLPWDGRSEPPRLEPRGARPGLLTRAALLLSTSANTRPIMKGVFIREYILCDTLPPPPANANNDGVRLDGKLTTRQVVERLTERDPNCATCHANLINPLGFVTENFDALARLRAEQRLFDDKGTELGRVAIETNAVPQVVVGDKRPASGVGDVVRQILESGKGPACLARNYFRFTFARWEEAEKDGCTLERLRRAVEAGGALPTMLREVALSPDFQQRVFP